MAKKQVLTAKLGVSLAKATEKYLGGNKFGALLEISGIGGDKFDAYMKSKTSKSLHEEILDAAETYLASKSYSDFPDRVLHEVSNNLVRGFSFDEMFDYIENPHGLMELMKSRGPDLTLELSPAEVKYHDILLEAVLSESLKRIDRFDGFLVWLLLTLRQVKDSAEAVPYKEYQAKNPQVFVRAEAELQALTKLWMLPSEPSAYFTGQVGMIAKIREELLKRKPVGITQAAGLVGEGGIGKTELALQYCNEYQNEYERVYWFSGRDRNALQADMVRAWERAHGRNEDEPPFVTAARMRNELLGSRGCLVVLDNVDDRASLTKEDEQMSEETKFDAALFAPLRGMRNAHVLITSRQDNWGDLATRLPVDKLSHEEGALLLLKRLTGNYEATSLSEFEQAEQDAASKLSELVDGFQLALDQAGATAQQYEWSAVRYLTEFEQRFLDLIQREPEAVLRPHDAVYATVKMSLEEIWKVSPQAEEFVRWCAYMPPDWIPEEVFRVDAGRVAESLADLALEDLILAARGQSLLHKDTKNDVYVMHRLIQRVVRLIDSGNDKGVPDRYDAMAEATNIASPGIGFEHRFGRERLLAVWRHLGEFAPPTEAIVRGLNWVAFHGFQIYRSIGFLNDAELAYQTALEVLGERHPETLTSMNNIASTYSHLGRPQDALELQQKVLDARREVRGERHPETLTGMNNLATTYSHLGRNQDALNLRQEVLKIQREVLGERHPDTLTSMSNLATTYKYIGRHQDALALQQKVLKIQPEVLGEQHPETLTSSYALAVISFEIQPNQPAIDQVQAALVGLEEQFDANHHDVKIVRNTLEQMKQYLAQNPLQE